MKSKKNSLMVEDSNHHNSIIEKKDNINDKGNQISGVSNSNTKINSHPIKSEENYASMIEESQIDRDTNDYDLTSKQDNNIDKNNQISITSNETSHDSEASEDSKTEKNYYTINSFGDKIAGPCTTLRNLLTLKIKGEEIVDKEIKRKKEYKLPESKDNKYVVLFRGIMFNKDLFTNEQRRKTALYADPAGRTVYSDAYFRNIGNYCDYPLGKYMSNEDTEKLKENLEGTTEHLKKFIDFLHQSTDLKIRVNNNIRQTLLFALAQLQVSMYAKIDFIIKGLIDYLKDRLESLKLSLENLEILEQAYKKFNDEIQPNFTRNFFISTTFKAGIAAKYAIKYKERQYVQKDSSAQQEENSKSHKTSEDSNNKRKNNYETKTITFDPQYDKEGKPKHRLGGIVEIMLIPSEKYLEEIKKATNTLSGSTTKDAPEFMDIFLLNKQNLISSGSIKFLEQSEVSFLNKISGEYVIDSLPVYYPNFKNNYDSNYHKKFFGMTEKIYRNFKEKLDLDKLRGHMIKNLTKKLDDLVSIILKDKQREISVLQTTDNTNTIAMKQIEKSYTKNQKKRTGTTPFAHYLERKRFQECIAKIYLDTSKITTSGLANDNINCASYFDDDTKSYEYLDFSSSKSQNESDGNLM